MKQKYRWLWITICVLLAIILAFVSVYHETVRVVFRNFTAPVYKLENPQEWSDGIIYWEVPYAEVSPSDYVNIYVPENVKNPPLFVLIHGGGFVNGDAEAKQIQMIYRFFRDRGIACASVNYRLAGEAPFPAAIEDCKAAIRFLRAHEAEYGYDAKRIAVFGESAGGYLAVMCAFTNDWEFNSLPFIGQSELGDVSAKVDILVDYYGAVEKGMERDLSAIGIPWIIYRIANYWGSEAAQGYESVDSYWFRKNISEMTAEELAFSDPYTYIAENLSENSPLSVWIVHGDCDLTIPYLQSWRLSENLKALLGEDNVIFRLVPNMGHASDPLFSDDELTLLDVFLRQHIGSDVT